MTRFFFLAAMAAALLIGVHQDVHAQTAAPKADDLAGKWHFVLDTPGGDRLENAQFLIDADGKVTGTYGKWNVAGSYSDKKMELSFPIDSEEGGSGRLKLSGTVDGDTITGTWEFTQYNGEFKATRVKN